MVFEAETEKPDAKVKWQSNSKDVVTGGRYAIAADGNRHSLTIRDVNREDANTYAVIAGGSKVKFDLKVVSKPGGRTGCRSCALKVKTRSLGSGTWFEARQPRCTEKKVTQPVYTLCRAILISQPPHCCMDTHPSTCTAGKTLKEAVDQRKKRNSAKLGNYLS